MPPICFWWFMISQCTLAPIWGRRMYSLGLIPCLQSLMILYISSHQDLDIFDTFQFLSSRSWRFWYFSVPTIKIVDERHQKVENQIFYDLGSTIKLKCMVGNIIIVILIMIIMMVINIRWRTSWGSSRSTSSGRRATGCSTMTRREEASGVLLLLLIFLSINFHFSVLSLYWYLAPECL